MLGDTPTTAGALAFFALELAGCGDPGAGDGEQRSASLMLSGGLECGASSLSQSPSPRRPWAVGAPLRATAWFRGDLLDCSSSSPDDVWSGSCSYSRVTDGELTVSGDLAVEEWGLLQWSTGSSVTLYSARLRPRTAGPATLLVFSSDNEPAAIETTASDAAAVEVSLPGGPYGLETHEWDGVQQSGRRAWGATRPATDEVVSQVVTVTGGHVVLTTRPLDDRGEPLCGRLPVEAAGRGLSFEAVCLDEGTVTLVAGDTPGPTSARLCGRDACTEVAVDVVPVADVTLVEADWQYDGNVLVLRAFAGSIEVRGARMRLLNMTPQLVEFDTATPTNEDVLELSDPAIGLYTWGRGSALIRVELPGSSAPPVDVRFDVEATG